MNFRRVEEVPLHMTRQFFELPCVSSAEKFPETDHIIWHLRGVRDFSCRMMDEKVWTFKAQKGAVALDYAGQWWHLTESEYDDWVDMMGLAYESMR